MPKLANETDLQYKRRVIDIKSDSFCGAKWYNATIWLGSGQTTSCHHPLPHQVSVEAVETNPKALHNTPEKKHQRAQMQRGERPSGCEYCWKIEDMHKGPVGDVAEPISDRVYKTVIYSDQDLDHAYRTPADQDVDLQTLEIAFDRTCQFACSYCNPAFSSTWVKDIKQHGPYADLVSDGRNHFTHAHNSSQLYKFGETNPYVGAFHRWWESDLHRTLKELRITGGEPLMSAETWKLIEWFKTNKGKSKARLAINSNLGTDVDVDRLLAAIDGVEVDLYTSNESMGLHAEYIRDGLVWQDWCNNVEKLLQSQKFRGLHVMCTVNALCLDSLDQFLDVVMNWKLEYGRDAINFSLNILRFPSFQSLTVLPDNMRNIYYNRLNDFAAQYIQLNLMHEFEFNQLTRLIDYVDVVQKPHEEAISQSILQRDFKNFYTQYDQRRGKDFCTTFPNLAEWYNTL
jgi:pyruvate-formate lyase-activating enzyme